MKQIIAIIALASTVGCASQPSTYTDKSTPDRRDIEATGAAATEAARSNSSQNVDVNSNVPLVRGTSVSYNGGGTDYSQLPGICCAYHPDGTRNYKREHDLYIERQYSRIQREQRNTYSGYASQRWSRELDTRIERKIDEKIRNVMDKLF